MAKLTNSKTEILSFEISPILSPFPTTDKLIYKDTDKLKRWIKEYQEGTNQSKLMLLYSCQISKTSWTKKRAFFRDKINRIH